MEGGRTAESMVTRLQAGWPPIPIGEEAAWAPQLVWVQQRRWEKSPPLLGIDPWLYDHSSHSLVTILSHPVLLLVTYFIWSQNCLLKNSIVFIQDHVYLSKNVCFREWLFRFEYELLLRNQDASTGYLRLKFKSRSVQMSNWTLAILTEVFHGRCQDSSWLGHSSTNLPFHAL